tara:strand:- start:458 stop:787 length:330 start_codon:yes stop_codon:yes gene_type:complete
MKKYLSNCIYFLSNTNIMAMKFDVANLFMSAKTPDDAAQRRGFIAGIKLAAEEHQKYIVRSEREITQLQRECNALALSRDKARKECDELKIQLAILKGNRDSMMASSPS